MRKMPSPAMFSLCRAGAKLPVVAALAVKRKRSNRKAPTMAEKLAALHIEIEALRGFPIADWETLRKMTAEQVCRLFQWHHTSYYTWVGHNHPTLLTPMYVMAHRERTAKIDNPAIAKVRRHLKQKALAALDLGESQSDPVLSKPDLARELMGLPKSQRKTKIKSRGFQGWRAFDGTVRWRKDRRQRKGE